MKNALAIAGAALTAAFVILAVPAVAADAAVPAATSTVVIPWGDWLGQLLLGLGSTVVVVLTWLESRFAPSIVKTFLTSDKIATAVNYAIATVANAEKGKAASIPVSNELIAAAAAWIIDAEPKIAKWAGANLEPLIIAELSKAGVVPAEASAATLGAAAAS